MQIVRTRPYLRDLKRMGVAEAEQEALEQAIATNPDAGAVIPGLGGIRKLRFGFGGRGKRGGGRAIYFAMIADDVAVMIFAYAKSEREDITPAQRKEALAVLKEFTDG